MTKLAPEWVRTSDPVIRSPARYRWTTAPAYLIQMTSHVQMQFCSNNILIKTYLTSGIFFSLGINIEHTYCIRQILDIENKFTFMIFEKSDVMWWRVILVTAKPHTPHASTCCDGGITL